MNLKLLAAAAAVAALTAGTVSAYTVSITSGQYYQGEYDTIQLQANAVASPGFSLQNTYFFTSMNGQTDNAAAGLIQLFTDYPNPGGSSTVLQSYCVDLLDNIVLGNGVTGGPATGASNGYPIVENPSAASGGYSAGPSLSTKQLNEVAFLAQFGEWVSANDSGTGYSGVSPPTSGLAADDYAIWFGDGSGSQFDLGLFNNSYYLDGDTSLSQTGGDIPAIEAVVQAGIWDVIYNGGSAPNTLSISFAGANNNYGCGSDASCDAASTEEAGYFAALKNLLSNLSLTGTGANLPQLQSAGVQDVQLVYASGALPEPGAWSLMIGGVFGIGAMVRRKRRAMASAA